MSFKAAVVECVLGHNKDKKYQRGEPYDKSCSHIGVKTKWRYMRK